MLPVAFCGDLIGHLEKVSFHCNHTEGKYQRMRNHTNALISHSSKIMITILQARLQQYAQGAFSDVHAGF